MVHKLTKQLPSTSYQHPGHHSNNHTVHFLSSLELTLPNLPLNSSPSALPIFIPDLELLRTSSNIYNNSTLCRQDHVSFNAAVLASFTKTSQHLVTTLELINLPAQMPLLSCVAHTHSFSATNTAPMGHTSEHTFLKLYSSFT